MTERRFPLAAGRAHSGDPQQDEIWRQLRQIIDYLGNTQFPDGDDGQVLTLVDGSPDWVDPSLTPPAGNVNELQIKASATAFGAVDGTSATGKWLKNVAGVPTWTTSPVPYQDIDLADGVTTASSTYTRGGARSLNMADYAGATSVVFKATIETALATSAYYARVRLFDITHNVAVTGTTMDNSALSSSDRATATEYTSSALTIGSASGNLRNDVETLYAVQIQLVGTLSSTTTDWVVLSNARLKVTS